jgi:crescentin
MSKNAEASRNGRSVAGADTPIELDGQPAAANSPEPGGFANGAAAASGAAAGPNGRERPRPSRPAAKAQRNADEWTQAEDSFVSIFDEAGATIRMFDQEKRHVLGLTRAVSQIQEGFDKLHVKFNDIENRVASFEGSGARMSYRVESTFDAIHECKDAEAELVKNHIELRTGLENTERKLAQQTDNIRHLTEENRALRETLTAVERDNRLVVDEIARMRNEIAVLDRGSGSERGREMSGGSRSSPIEADRAGAPSAPREPPQAQCAANPNPVDGDLDRLISEINESIDFHKGELGRMHKHTTELMARLAGIDGPNRRLAIGRSDPAKSIDKVETAVATSRTDSERKLAELKALSNSYQTLVQDLEQSRAALTSRTPEAEEAPPAPDLVPAKPPAIVFPRPPHAVNGSADGNKINTMRSMYETRTEQLKAELVQERRERKLAEGALRVSRAERVQLQRELATFRATGWREIKPDASAEPLPGESAPAKCGISAA